MARITQIVIAFDHETGLVGMEIRDVPIGLAQMMLDEAVRQLDIQRRAAAAMQMRQTMADQALAASIRGGARNRG